FGVTNILYSSDRNKSTEIHKSLKLKFGDIYPRVFSMIEYHWEGLLAHQKDNNIPKTNNIAENRNRQIKRRFKTIEAFQSEISATNYLILICNYLRFKPYTDCRKNRKSRNGKSPLEICGLVES
ncbi:MAG: transposase, partial [Nanoarchaeota archaeon]